MQAFQHLDRIHRSAAHLHRNPYRSLAFRIHTEKADGAVLVAKSGPAHVENVLHSFEVDGAIDAQVRTRTLGEIAGQLDVYGDGSVLNGRIDARDRTIGQAVVRIDRGRLSQA